MANRRRRAQRAVAQDPGMIVARKEAGQEIGRIQRQGAGAARGIRGASRRAGSYYTRAAANVPRNIATRGLVGNQLRAMGAQTARYGEGLATLATKGAAMDAASVRRELAFSQQQATLEAMADQAEADAEAKAEAKIENRAAKREAGALAREAFKAGVPLPSDKDQWYLFAKDVSKAEGVGMQAALRAARRLRTRIEQRPEIMDKWRAQAERRLEQGPVGSIRNWQGPW